MDDANALALAIGRALGLISQVEDEPATRIGVLPSHAELKLGVLRKLGVPDSAIDFFGNANGNTWDEALALQSFPLNLNREGDSLSL
jgi:hypothetical protein